jgi:hypothetical protein
MAGGAFPQRDRKKFSLSDAGKANAYIEQRSAVGHDVLQPGTGSYGSNTALYNPHLAQCQPAARRVSRIDPRRRVNGHERP